MTAASGVPYVPFDVWVLLVLLVLVAAVVAGAVAGSTQASDPAVVVVTVGLTAFAALFGGSAAAGFVGPAAGVGLLVGLGAGLAVELLVPVVGDRLGPGEDTGVARALLGVVLVFASGGGGSIALYLGPCVGPGLCLWRAVLPPLLAVGTAEWLQGGIRALGRP